MSIEAVLARFAGVMKQRDGWVARCPAHDDHRQSLSIGGAPDGKILLYCHAGCDTAAVIAKAGLTWADLAPERPSSNGNARATAIATTYDYVDEVGTLLHQTVRFEPKDFRQRRPDGHGGWIWNLAGVHLVLYRLPDLKGQKTVYIVEGEKDADALWKLSLPATTNALGAGKWRPDYTQQLVEAGVTRVALLPDNDESGRAHAGTVAGALHAAGIAIKIVALPGLAAKGDVSDYLAAGHTRADLAQLVLATPVWSPSLAQTPSMLTSPYPDDLKLETVAEAQQKIGQQTDWLVDGMLAVGDMSVLVAKPGVGKSTFAAQLAVSVAYGWPFLGRRTQQGLVVILAFEGARTTMAHMVRLGHDPESQSIRMWRGDADTKNPAAWLDSMLNANAAAPVLVIVDTLADLARARHGAANAGYEDMMAKLGAMYSWAQARRAHIHLLHHGAKGDREGIDTALGTIGIVGKPGTVLDYRKMNPKDERPLRVLKGEKHREGTLEDLPAVVLDFDQENGLTVAGRREDVAVRELGVEIIRVVAQSPDIKQVEMLAAVEGRKGSKLEALRLLTDPTTGVLTRTGTPGSRNFPLRLAVRADLDGDPIAAWKLSRDSSSPRESSRFRWVPENGVGSQTPGTYISERQDRRRSSRFPPILSNSGTYSKNYEASDRVGSRDHDYMELAATTPGETTLAPGDPIPERCELPTIEAVMRLVSEESRTGDTRIPEGKADYGQASSKPGSEAAVSPQPVSHAAPAMRRIEI